MSEIRPIRKPRFAVVFVPTAAGKKQFGWKERVLAKCQTKEKAAHVRQLQDTDEPAPDKHVYRSIVIREISQSQ